MRNVEEFTDEVFRRKDEFETARKQQKQTMRRRLTAPLTAFAIMLSIGVVGVAAAVLSGSDWFAGLYNKHSNDALSETQLQYLVDNTMDIHQTVSSDGFTMTLGAVNSSRNLFDAYIHVVAPEGTSLDGVNLGPITLTREDGQEVFYNRWMAYFVKDDDGKANTRTYAFRVQAPKMGEDKGYIFSQGGPLKMTISRLDYAGEKIVSWGEWSFDLTFIEKNETEKAIITEPIVVNSYDWLYNEYVGNVKITSFTLYDLFGSGTFEILEVEDGMNFRDTHINVQVFFKDGTTATANSGECRDFYYSNKGIDGSKEFMSGFSEPIILSEIDYVVFGGYRDENWNLIDGVKVDIP